MHTCVRVAGMHFHIRQTVGKIRVMQEQLNKCTVSHINDTDVAHYKFDAEQPILIIFGRDIADRVHYQT